MIRTIQINLKNKTLSCDEFISKFLHRLDSYCVYHNHAAVDDGISRYSLCECRRVSTTNVAIALKRSSQHLASLQRRIFHADRRHLANRFAELLSNDESVVDESDTSEDGEESRDYGEAVRPRQVVEVGVGHPQIVRVDLDTKHDQYHRYEYGCNRE